MFKVYFVEFWRQCSCEKWELYQYYLSKMQCDDSVPVLYEWTLEKKAILHIKFSNCSGLSEALDIYSLDAVVSCYVMLHLFFSQYSKKYL